MATSTSKRSPTRSSSHPTSDSSPEALTSPLFNSTSVEPPQGNRPRTRGSPPCPLPRRVGWEKLCAIGVEALGKGTAFRAFAFRSKSASKARTIRAASCEVVVGDIIGCVRPLGAPTNAILLTRQEVSRHEQWHYRATYGVCGVRKNMRTVQGRRWSERRRARTNRRRSAAPRRAALPTP